MIRNRSLVLLALTFAAVVGFIALVAFDRYGRPGRFIHVITVGLPGRTNRTFRAREIHAWPWAAWGRYRFHDEDSGEEWDVPESATIYRRIPTR